MKLPLRWVIALSVLWASGAAAQTGDTLFDGPRYRYENLWLVPRAASTLLAIPAGVTRWEPADFALFSVFATSTAVLMLPLHDPLDARIQRGLQIGLGPEHFRVWTFLGDKAIWASIWAAVFGAGLYGWAADDPRFIEQLSLSLEAFAVAQIYQLVFKLSLGREGPMDGEGHGKIGGPAAGFRLFPSGTPSGHAATLYALIGVTTTYWSNPNLALALHLFGVALCVTLVLDDYHFVSDVIWGASMGYFIGRWVVHHRSSHPPSSAGSTSAMPLLVPLVQPSRGAYGLGLVWEI